MDRFTPLEDHIPFNTMHSVISMDTQHAMNLPTDGAVPPPGSTAATSVGDYLEHLVVGNSDLSDLRLTAKPSYKRVGLHPNTSKPRAYDIPFWQPISTPVAHQGVTGVFSSSHPSLIQSGFVFSPRIWLVGKIFPDGCTKEKAREIVLEEADRLSLTPYIDAQRTIVAGQFGANYLAGDSFCIQFFDSGPARTAAINLVTGAIAWETQVMLRAGAGQGLCVPFLEPGDLQVAPKDLHTCESLLRVHISGVTVVHRHKVHSILYSVAQSLFRVVQRAAPGAARNALNDILEALQFYPGHTRTCADRKDVLIRWCFPKYRQLLVQTGFLQVPTEAWGIVNLEITHDPAATRQFTNTRFAYPMFLPYASLLKMLSVKRKIRTAELRQTKQTVRLDELPYVLSVLHELGVKTQRVSAPVRLVRYKQHSNAEFAVVALASEAELERWRQHLPWVLVSKHWFLAYQLLPVDASQGEQYDQVDPEDGDLVDACSDTTETVDPFEAFR